MTTAALLAVVGVLSADAEELGPRCRALVRVHEPGLDGLVLG